MISLETVADLTGLDVGVFAGKPTTLTPGQKEASTLLWSSPDGKVKIGIWECMPGQFTADRSSMGEYCHILSGRAWIWNADGSEKREIGPGDLLVLPQGWTGEWAILEHMRKLFIITTL